MLLWWLGGKLLIFFRRPSIRRTGVISGGRNMGQSAPSRFSISWSCDLICIPKIRSDASHCKQVELSRDKFAYFRVRIKTMSKRPSIGMHSLLYTHAWSHCRGGTCPCAPPAESAPGPTTNYWGGGGGGYFPDLLLRYNLWFTISHPDAFSRLYVLRWRTRPVKQKRRCRFWQVVKQLLGILS